MTGSRGDAGEETLESRQVASWQRQEPTRLCRTASFMRVSAVGSVDELDTSTCSPRFLLVVQEKSM